MRSYFKIKKYNIFLIYSFSFLIIFGIFLYFFITNKESDTLITQHEKTTIILDFKTVKSADTNNNSLYKLKIKDKEFLLASDKEISSNAANYNLELLHKNYLWNPNSCAKTPVTINQNKFIFIENLKNLQEGQFMQLLIIFDFEKKELIEISLPFRVVSYVYIKNERFYLVQDIYDKDKNLEQVKIYDLNIEKKSLTLSDSLYIEKEIGYPVKNPTFKKNENNLVVSYLDSKYKINNYAYYNNKLESVKLENNNSFFENNEYLVNYINNSKLKYKQSLNSFDHIEILDVLISNNKANMYIVGEISK